jgi:alkylation response protein AidB-like acyl-CoA dehydrogenase
MDVGKATLGQVARAKAHVTKLGRETVALAREVCGGNGIIMENRVIKAFLDMEAMYTYEGTYDINSLVSGRELTGGLSAIR